MAEWKLSDLLRFRWRRMPERTAEERSRGLEVARRFGIDADGIIPLIDLPKSTSPGSSGVSAFDQRRIPEIKTGPNGQIDGRDLFGDYAGALAALDALRTNDKK